MGWLTVAWKKGRGNIRPTGPAKSGERVLLLELMSVGERAHACSASVGPGAPCFRPPILTCCSFHFLFWASSNDLCPSPPSPVPTRLLTPNDENTVITYSLNGYQISGIRQAGRLNPVPRRKKDMARPKRPYTPKVKGKVYRRGTMCTRPGTHRLRRVLRMFTAPHQL